MARWTTLPLLALVPAGVGCAFIPDWNAEDEFHVFADSEFYESPRVVPERDLLVRGAEAPRPEDGERLGADVFPLWWFSALDADGDGYIDRREWAAGLPDRSN